MEDKIFHSCPKHGKERCFGRGVNDLHWCLSDNVEDRYDESWKESK